MPRCEDFPEFAYSDKNAAPRSFGTGRVSLLQREILTQELADIGGGRRAAGNTLPELAGAAPDADLSRFSLIALPDCNLLRQAQRAVFLLQLVQRVDQRVIFAFVRSAQPTPICSARPMYSTSSTR